MSTADSLGFGVIGVGAIGRLHAEHLATRVPRARLVAIADINAAVASREAERLDVAAYPDHAALLADPAITAVAICTPRGTHARIITDAAGHTEEVKGPGVVGEQPVLAPGESFKYSSWCPLKTPIGVMRGTLVPSVKVARTTSN